MSCAGSELRRAEPRQAKLRRTELPQVVVLYVEGAGLVRLRENKLSFFNFLFLHLVSNCVYDGTNTEIQAPAAPAIAEAAPFSMRLPVPFRAGCVLPFSLSIIFFLTTLEGNWKE